jgi:ParB/RepB/Spo0J family partition protein
MRDSGHLSFDVIDQNPYRDLIHNPVREEQVEQLAASVRSTGYWHNTMVRPHPTRPGRYQLAYGHARLEAARRMGLTSATFTVRDLSDERMIHVMADENITQFGKDRFATCKEATVAATWLMRAVIEQREGARRFLRTLDAEQDQSNKTLNDILVGGCPGERVIAGFFNGTVPIADIRLALLAFRETGELAAWHKANNPTAQQADAPTLDAEALKRFDKPDHVRAFVKAVRETNTPVAPHLPIVRTLNTLSA